LLFFIPLIKQTACSNLAANQKAVAKQSAFSSNWQAAVGWLRSVCWCCQ